MNKTDQTVKRETVNRMFDADAVNKWCNVTETYNVNKIVNMSVQLLIV